MKKFAFVLPDGTPAYTATPSVDDVYTDGTAYGDVVCREVPFETTDTEILTTWFWNNGWEQRPAKPAPYFIWENGAWVDGRSLEDLKAAKNREINEARLAANRSTFTFSGQPISCDELSRSDIDGMNGAVSILGDLPPDFFGAWKTEDNNYISIPDVETWKAFYCAMVQQGQLNFIHAQALKAALAAATTAAEVEAITW